MNERDIRFIQALKKGFKLERRPFTRIALELEMDEEQVIQKIEEFQQKGLIRRIGVAVRPTRAGFACNAMVAWEVGEDRVEEVGKMCAQIREISHCYDRQGPPGWTHNFFTMIHATSEDHLNDLVENIKKKCQLTSCTIYRTLKEFKKSSPDFFPSGGTKE